MDHGPQQRLRAEGPVSLQLHPVEQEPQKWPGLLTTSCGVFSSQGQRLLWVEEFLSSGDGQTTAAFDYLENNLQFTTYSLLYLIGMLGATL